MNGPLDLCHTNFVYSEVVMYEVSDTEDIDP